MTQAAAPASQAQNLLPDEPFPAVAREGWPIVAGFVLVSAALTGAAFHWFGFAVAVPIGVVCAALCIWCVWFFRDPQRRIPNDAAAVIAPADGVVCMIGPAEPPPELELQASQTAQMLRICIFMNVFNVHVNRAPAAGIVVASHYRPGKFFNASLDKASVDNERSSLALRTADGQVIAFVQIAGLIARRIISRVREGDKLRPGQRYGLIRFGSRVDVYLPPGSTAKVKLNQKTVAGETIIATRAIPPHAPA